MTDLLAHNRRRSCFHMLSASFFLLLQAEPCCFITAFENELFHLAVAVPEQLPNDKERPVTASEDGVDRVAFSPLGRCKRVS